MEPPRRGLTRFRSRLAGVEEYDVPLRMLNVLVEAYPLAVSSLVISPHPNRSLADLR